MTTERAAIEAPQTQFSSGLIPGRLPGVDGRSWAARRYRELVTGMCSDLGGDDMAITKQAIVCRAAALMSWCEKAEADYANTGKLDVQTYTTSVNALRRLLADLGLERRARDVPDLQTWMKQREANG